MANNGPTNSINEAAVRWAVQAAYGDMPPEDRVIMDGWLAEDRRHQGAYVRACAWIRATEEAVTEAHATTGQPRLAAVAPVILCNDNELAEDARPDRRRPGLSGWRSSALAGISGLAACLVALLATGLIPLPVARHPDASAAGQVLALKDGSIATLTGGARVEVRLSASHRWITLLKGEATFQVAKDATRPFVVRSGEVYAQATGTVYSVRRVGATGGTIVVHKGSVLVWLRGKREQAVLVAAGGRTTLDPSAQGAVPKMRSETLRTLPLTQISLDNVPLKLAVERFNRVNSTKIVIADEALGDVTIIGLYNANEPAQFARAAAIVSGGVVEEERNSIVIKLK